MRKIPLLKAVPFVIIIVFGIAATTLVRDTAERTERARFLEEAEIVAASIDARDLQRLSGTLNDITDSDYLGLKEQMIKIRQNADESRFVYLIGSRNDQIFFYVDSEPSDSLDYSAPGDIYTEVDPLVMQHFVAGTGFVLGPYHDRWGTWMSAFAPVLDPDTGRPLANIGLDISAHQWEEAVWSREILPVIITLFALILLTIYYHYRHRRQEFISALATQEKRLQTLYEIASMQDVEGDKGLQAALQAGIDALHLDIGIISKVEGDVYTVEHVISPKSTIKPGDTFSFKRMYCELAYKAKGVVGIEHAGTSKYKGHACYKDFKLEAYIGVPLVVDGKNRGTLCFSAAKPRRTSFSEAEKDFLRLLGKWVSATLERKWDHERLKEVDRMKSEFVSVASHQLRTPLTGIKWFCQLLLGNKAGKLNPDQKDFIEQVSTSNDRMIRLVEDLLNVSRIETGRKFEIVKKPLDVPALVQSVVDEHLPLCAKRTQTINYTPPASFPTMKVDEQKIRQVLGNLVSNALKYSPVGSTVDVTLTMDAKKHAIVTVTDQGIGIPPAGQKRIFEKFFRAENAVVSETDGTGLGLYIAKSICGAHGGGLTFTSIEGKGSTFIAVF